MKTKTLSCILGHRPERFNIYYLAPDEQSDLINGVPGVDEELHFNMEEPENVEQVEAVLHGVICKLQSEIPEYATGIIKKYEEQKATVEKQIQLDRQQKEESDRINKTTTRLFAYAAKAGVKPHELDTMIDWIQKDVILQSCKDTATKSKQLLALLAEGGFTEKDVMNV